MSDERLLDPHQKPPGVRRVGRLPLFLGVGLVLVILLMITQGIKSRSKTREARENTPARVSVASVKPYVQELVGEIRAGIVPAEPPRIPEPPAPAPEVNLIPTDELVAQLKPPKGDELLPPRRSALTAPMDGPGMQEFEQALRSRTGIQVLNLQSGRVVASGQSQGNQAEMQARMAEARRRQAALASQDPGSAYQARMAQIRGMASEAPGPYEGNESGLMAARGPSLADYEGRGGDRWTLEDSEPVAPRTPYELRAGFVIPAIMLSGINSDLPGQVIAQVSQNVWDTATGRHLLIPQGTRLIGTYGNSVAFGQERVFMAWQRLIFPDGRALDIGSMPGTDSAGYAGFKDQVDNHYFRTFASAFLMSGVVAGVSLSQDRSGNREGNSQRSSDALSEALGQQLGAAMAQILMKNLNVAPTLTIRPGYRMNVMVVKDIAFKRPYSSFDYMGDGR